MPADASSWLAIKCVSNLNPTRVESSSSSKTILKKNCHSMIRQQMKSEKRYASRWYVILCVKSSMALLWQLRLKLCGERARLWRESSPSLFFKPCCNSTSRQQMKYERKRVCEQEVCAKKQEGARLTNNCDSNPTILGGERAQLWQENSPSQPIFQALLLLSPRSKIQGCRQLAHIIFFFKI